MTTESVLQPAVLRLVGYSQVTVEAYRTDAGVGGDAVLARGAVLALVRSTLVHVDLRTKNNLKKSFVLICIILICYIYSFQIYGLMWSAWVINVVCNVYVVCSTWQ